MVSANELYNHRVEYKREATCSTSGRTGSVGFKSCWIMTSALGAGVSTEFQSYFDLLFSCYTSNSPL